MSVSKPFRSLQLLREEIVFTATVFGSLTDYSVDAVALQEIDPSPREVFRDALTLENATQQDLVDFIDNLRIRTCRGDYLLTHDALADLYDHARLVWEEGQARSGAPSIEPANEESPQHHLFAPKCLVQFEGDVKLHPQTSSDQHLPSRGSHDTTALLGEAQRNAPQLQSEEDLAPGQIWENAAEQASAWATPTSAATGAVGVVHIRTPPSAGQVMRSGAPSTTDIHTCNDVDEAMAAPGKEGHSCQPPADQDESAPQHVDYEEESPAVPQMLARESFSAPRYGWSLADAEAAPRLQSSGAVTPGPTAVSSDALSATDHVGTSISTACATESVCTPPDLNPNQARARLYPSAPPPSPAQGAFCPIPPVPKVDKGERAPDGVRPTVKKPTIRRSSTSSSSLPACSAPLSYTAVTMHQKPPTPPQSGSTADSDTSKSKAPSSNLPSFDGPSPVIAMQQVKGVQGQSIGPLAATAFAVPAAMPPKRPSAEEFSAIASGEFSMSRRSSSQFQMPQGLRSWDATIEDAAGSGPSRDACDAASELVQQEVLRQASAGSGRSMLVVSEAFCKAARQSRSNSQELLSQSASKYSTSQRRAVSDGKLIEAREDATDKEKVVHGASNIMDIISQQSPAHSAANDTLMQSSKVDASVPTSLDTSLNSSTALLVEPSSQNTEPSGRTWDPPGQSGIASCTAVSKGLAAAAHKVKVAGVSADATSNELQEDIDASTARRDYTRDADSASPSSSDAEKRISSASRAAATSGYKGVESPTSTGRSTSALFSEGAGDHNVERRVSDSNHSLPAMSQNDQDEYVMVEQEECSVSAAAADPDTSRSVGVSRSGAASKQHVIGGAEAAANRSFTFAPAITFGTDTGTYHTSEVDTDILSNDRTVSYVQHSYTSVSGAEGSRHVSQSGLSQQMPSVIVDGAVSDVNMHAMHAYASPEFHEVSASPSPEGEEVEGPPVLSEPQAEGAGADDASTQPESADSSAGDPDARANDQEEFIEEHAGESVQIIHTEECVSESEVHTQLDQDSADTSHRMHDVHASHNESEDAYDAAAADSAAAITEVQGDGEMMESEQSPVQSKVFTAHSEDIAACNDVAELFIEQRLAPLFSTRFFKSGQSPRTAKPPSHMDRVLREAQMTLQQAATHTYAENAGKRHPELTLPEILTEQSASKKPRETQNSPNCDTVPSILTQTTSTASGVVLHAVHSVGSERTCAIIERQSAPKGAAPLAISPAAAAPATQLCSTLEDPVLGRPQGCSPISNISTVMNDEVQQDTGHDEEEGVVSGATQDTDAADAAWILVDEHSGSGQSSPRSNRSDQHSEHSDAVAPGEAVAIRDASGDLLEPSAPEVISPDGSVFIAPGGSAAAPVNPDESHPLPSGPADSAEFIDAETHAEVAEQHATTSETPARTGAADDVSVPKLAAEASGSGSEVSRMSQSVVHERDGVPAAPWAGTATCSGELQGSTLRHNTLTSAPVSSQDTPRTGKAHGDRPRSPPTREPEPFFSSSLLEQNPKEEDVIEYIIDDSSRQTSAAIAGEAVEPVLLDAKVAALKKAPHRLENNSRSAKVSSRARGGLRGAAAFYRAMTSCDSDAPRSATNGTGLFASDTLCTCELEPSTELQDTQVAAAQNRLVSCGSPTNPILSMSAQPSTHTAHAAIGASNTAESSQAPLARTALREAAPAPSPSAPRSHLVSPTSHAWESDLEASEASPRAPVSATCYEVAAGTEGGASKHQSQRHEAVETTALALDPRAASQAAAPARANTPAAVDSSALPPVIPSRLSMVDASALNAASEPQNEAVSGKAAQASMQASEPASDAEHTIAHNAPQTLPAESQSTRGPDTRKRSPQEDSTEMAQHMSPSAELDALDVANREDADADAQAALDSLEQQAGTKDMTHAKKDDAEADVTHDSAADSEEPSADALLASLENLSKEIAAASASIDGSRHGETSKDAQDSEMSPTTEVTSQYIPPTALAGSRVVPNPKNPNVGTGQAPAANVGGMDNTGMGGLQPLMHPFGPPNPRTSAPHEPAVQLMNFAVPQNATLPLAPQPFAPGFAAPAIMWPAVGPHGQAMPVPNMPTTAQMPATAASPPVAVPMFSGSRGASPVRSPGMLSQKYQAARSSSADPRAQSTVENAPARGQPDASLLNVDPALNASKSHSSPFRKRTTPISSSKTASVSPKPGAGRKSGSLRKGTKAAMDVSEADAVLSAANAAARFGVKRSGSAVQQERSPQPSSATRLGGAAGSRSQSPPGQATAAHVHTAVGAPKKCTKLHHVTTASAANAAAGASAMRAKGQLSSQISAASEGVSVSQMQDRVVPGTAPPGSGSSGLIVSTAGDTQKAGSHTPHVRMSTQEDSLLTQQLQLQELSARAAVHAAATLRRSATSGASSSSANAHRTTSSIPAQSTRPSADNLGGNPNINTYTPEDSVHASGKPAEQYGASKHAHKPETEQQHSDAGAAQAVFAREATHPVGSSVRGHSAGQSSCYPTSGSPASRKDDTSIELPLGALSGTELPGSDSPVAAKQVEDSPVVGAPTSGGDGTSQHQNLLPRLKCSYLAAANVPAVSTEEASPSAHGDSPLHIEYSELTPVNTEAQQSDQTPITTPTSSVLATLATTMAPNRSAVEQSPQAESAAADSAEGDSAGSPINCYERVNKQLSEGIKANLISSEYGAPTSVSAGLGSLATQTVATSELVDSMILDASGTGLRPPYSTGSDLHGYSQYPVDSEYWQSQYMKEPEQAGGLARDALRQHQMQHASMAHPRTGPEGMVFAAHYSGPLQSGPVSVTAEELANGSLQPLSTGPEHERTEHTAAGDGVVKVGNDRKPVSALSQFLQARGAEAVRYSPPQSSSFYPESGSVEKGSARLRHEASTQGYEATFTPQDDDDEEDDMSSSGTPVPCSPLKASASEGADSARTHTPVVASSVDGPLSHSSSKHRAGAAAPAAVRTPRRQLESTSAAPHGAVNEEKEEPSQAQEELNVIEGSSEGVSEGATDPGPAEQVRACGTATLVQEDFPPDSPEATHASPDTSQHATSPHATSPQAPAAATASSGYAEETNVGDKAFTRFRPARMQLMKSRDPYEASGSFHTSAESAPSPDGCSAAQHYSSAARRNAEMHAQSRDSASAKAGRAASALASSSFRSYAPTASRPSKKFSWNPPTCAADVVYSSYPALPAKGAVRGSSPPPSRALYNRDMQPHGRGASRTPSRTQSSERSLKERGHSRTVSKHCRNHTPDEVTESPAGASTSRSANRQDSYAVSASAASTNQSSERAESQQKAQLSAENSATTSSPSAVNRNLAEAAVEQVVEQKPRGEEEYDSRPCAGDMDSRRSDSVQHEGRSSPASRQSGQQSRALSRTTSRTASNTGGLQAEPNLPTGSQIPEQQLQEQCRPKTETRAIKKGQKLALSAYRNCNKFPTSARPNNPMRNTFPSRPLWPPTSDSEYGGDTGVQLNAITDVLPQASPMETQVQPPPAEPRVPPPVEPQARRTSGGSAGSGSSALLAHARGGIIRAGGTRESNTRDSTRECNTRESSLRESHTRESMKLNNEMPAGTSAVPAADSRQRKHVDAHRPEAAQQERHSRQYSQGQDQVARRRPEVPAGDRQGAQCSADNMHRSKSRSRAHRSNGVMPALDTLQNAAEDWADSRLYSPTRNTRALDPEPPQVAVQASSSGRILSRKPSNRYNEARYVPPEPEPEIQPAGPRPGVHGYSRSRVEQRTAADPGYRTARRPSPPGRRAAVGLRSRNSGNSYARGARRSRQDVGR